MKRYISLFAVAAVTTVLIGSTASAQWHRSSHWHDQPGYTSHFGGRDLSRPVVHTPDIHLLTSYTGRLKTVAIHLHDDAHALSRGYRRSAAIERYVSQIERLQTHMHDSLRQAASHRITDAVCLGHIRSDVRQVASLVDRLDRELGRQTKDGVCPSDYRLITHMRLVIASEMHPLLELVNDELTGHPSHAVSSYPKYGQTRSLSRRPSFSISWGF